MCAERVWAAFPAPAKHFQRRPEQPAHPSLTFLPLRDGILSLGSYCDSGNWNAEEVRLCNFWSPALRGPDACIGTLLGL